MRKPALVLALFLALGITASAQDFTGSIYGRIVDPTNALLPGVSITVEGTAIQGKRTAVSEGNGTYRFLYLPQGEYRITYEKARFKKIVYEGAKVEVDKTTTMNVAMRRCFLHRKWRVTSPESSCLSTVEHPPLRDGFAGRAAGR